MPITRVFRNRFYPNDKVHHNTESANTDQSLTENKKENRTAEVNNEAAYLTKSNFWKKWFVGLFK